MTKVIDTFLFFQELDLAEIRMAYLNPLVDHFVIVEAAQTFSGNAKPFIFEENKKRFAQFADKILYIKIKDQHTNYHSVVDHLSVQDDAASAIILSVLEGHVHYDKKNLAWVLDSYHRECIHHGLSLIAEANDIVLLSDLDEIPSRARIIELVDSPPASFVDMLHHEFRYFLNFYKDSDWLGTIAGPASGFKGRSLNELRVDSKANRTMFSQAPLSDSGWHFTSVGDIEAIRKKIQSWAHQEYNTGFTMSTLEKNIRSGQDIFNRETGTTLTQLDIATSDLFHDEMRTILMGYPKLIATDRIETVAYSHSRDLIRRIRKLWVRLGYEIRKLVMR